MLAIINIAIHLIKITPKNIGVMKIANYVTLSVRLQRTNNVVEGFLSKLGKIVEIQHTNV